MLKSALHGMSAPTSFSTRRRMGEFFLAARNRPISPPMDVPTQSIFRPWASARPPAGALARRSIAGAPRGGVVVVRRERVFRLVEPATPGAAGHRHARPAAKGRQRGREIVEVAAV